MKKIYAIRDRVAQEIVSLQIYCLFIFKTDEQAIRYFADCIMDDKSILNKHPNDYELITVGTITDEGNIGNQSGTQVVITGSQITSTLKLAE